MTGAWPITIADVLQARKRIRDALPKTPLRRYAPLDEAVGYGIKVFVKHENHPPTQNFKARTGLSARTPLGEEEKKPGLVPATPGKPGQGVAAGGAAVPVAVPSRV